MVVLKENDAREIKELRRTSTSRPIGFFFPDDVMTKNDGQGGSIVIPATPTNDGT